LIAKVVTPILVAPVGNGALRYFKSPLGCPDFAWHSVDDLAVCVGLGLLQEIQRHFHHTFVGGPFMGNVRVVGTADGIVTIAPHNRAARLIDAAVAIGFADRSVAESYADGGAIALRRIAGDRPPRAAFEFVRAAARTALGALV
jgi:hypothetical protein